ncbi:MAG: hypothetical protein ACE5MI_05965 [Acidimicrobiia bacterium]
MAKQSVGVGSRLVEQVVALLDLIGDILCAVDHLQWRERFLPYLLWHRRGAACGSYEQHSTYEWSQ